VLALAGLPIGFAIARLPGRGGHEPAEGIKTGTPTQPIELPGVVLAALASIGLGFVVGPEAPLIALGMGLAIFAVQRVRREAPDPIVAVLAAASLCGDLDHLRVADRRGGHPDRGGGAGGTHDVARAAPRHDGSRHRLTGLHRPR
jgi:hypothetical protein